MARGVQCARHPMRPPAAALALLAACHAPDYHPPPWDPPRRAAVSTGCLELTAGLMTDGLGKVPGIPVRISFHSACKEPVLLDVRRVRVLARLAAGSDGGDPQTPGGWVALSPYDPDEVMHSGLLAPDDVGDEPIEYQGPGGALLGWALEVGGNAATGHPFVFSGQSFVISGSTYFSPGFNAAAGLAAGPLFLRGEIFAGAQMLALNTAGSAPGDSLFDVHFRLAPRVSAEAWITDYLTVGLGGAADVIYRDDFMLGAFLRGYYDKRGVHDPRL
jgi:hypothetical protein